MYINIFKDNISNLKIINYIIKIFVIKDIKQYGQISHQLQMV